MPIITNKYSETTFPGTGSSWPDLSGTNSYSYFTTVNTTDSSQNISYSTTSGVASYDFTPPAFGNTILNFATGASVTSLTTAPAATPAANRLVLIAVESQVASGTASAPTITAGCGLTWTQVTTQTFGVRRITVFKSSGASPTNANFTIDFASQTQARIYAWGYDFTNTDYASAGSAVVASNQNSSTTSNQITVTVGTIDRRGGRTVFFGARASATSPTSGGTGSAPYYDHWTAANSQGVGDMLLDNYTGTWNFGTSVNNAIIGVRIAPCATPSTSTKTFLCSSPSTPATLANGSLKIGVPLTFVTGANTSIALPELFVWAPTSTSVDTYNTSYSAKVDYTAGKGADGNFGTSDDNATATFSIVQRTPSGSTTLATASFTEVTGTSNYRTIGEIWNIELLVSKETSTQSRLAIIWDVPPSPGETARKTGSVSTSLITTPASDLAFGVTHTNFNSASSTNKFEIDYLIVSDYSVVPKQAKLQGVNRSAVW
jgi:hypothetical protein